MSKDNQILEEFTSGNITWLVSRPGSGQLLPVSMKILSGGSQLKRRT